MDETTVATTHDHIYSSHIFVENLARTMAAHAAVGDDFPDARPALLENLRTSQAMLPAAIAAVQGAMDEEQP